MFRSSLLSRSLVSRVAGSASWRSNVRLSVPPTLSPLARASTARTAVTVPSATKAESSTENAKSLQFYHEGLKKWNADDPQGAIDCYFKSIEEKPSSDAYYNIGNCYLQLGDHEAAALAWAQSIELAPDRSDARVNLGNVYAMVLKETDKALPQLAEAVRLDPEDGEIQYNYAAMLDSAGQLDKAVEHYKLAVKLGVPRAEKNLRNALARLLAEQTAKGI